MYLHLGQETVIKTDDIVGIFDLDTTTISKTTREYLTKSEKNGEVVNVSYDLPKSFTVTSTNKKSAVYISPISSSTLLKRTCYIRDISKIISGENFDEE